MKTVASFAWFKVHLLACLDERPSASTLHVVSAISFEPCTGPHHHEWGWQNDGAMSLFYDIADLTDLAPMVARYEAKLYQAAIDIEKSDRGTRGAVGGRCIE